jgi:tetratricopeptide (TPR) repeat protein
VLDAQKGKLPPDHPNILRSKHNLGLLYWQMKKLDQSILLLQEVLKFERVKLRPNDDDLLRTQAHLGRAYRDAGRPVDAIPLLEEVRRQGAPVSVAWAGRWLLTSYVEAGKKREAAALAAALMQEARKKFSADSLELAAALGEVGMGFLAGKSYVDAEPFLRESYSLGEQKAPDAWATHHSRAMLGDALLGQKKYAGAEPHIVAGYQGMKKLASGPERKSSRRSDKLQLLEALERMVQLYEATNRPDEAAQWRKELETTKEKP